MNDLREKQDALIATAKRCFDLRLQTNAGGNLSVRLDHADAIVIKPSGVGFNECTRDNLQLVHLDGTIESSPYKPSKDLGFHLDLYRLGDAQELAYLGLGDYLSAQGILLIEWPERAEAQLPRATLDITLTPEGSGRKATVRAGDPVLLEALSD